MSPDLFAFIAWCCADFGITALRCSKADAGQLVLHVDCRAAELEQKLRECLPLGLSVDVFVDFDLPATRLAYFGRCAATEAA